MPLLPNRLWHGYSIPSNYDSMIAKLITTRTHQRSMSKNRLEGVSFKNSKFEDNLDLKFAMIDGDFNINGMRVAFNIENKYTQINGQSFSKFLVHKN